MEAAKDSRKADATGAAVDDSAKPLTRDKEDPMTSSHDTFLPYDSGKLFFPPCRIHITSNQCRVF